MKMHKRLMQSLRDIENDRYKHSFIRPKSSFRTRNQGKKITLVLTKKH